MSNLIRQLGKEKDVCRILISRNTCNYPGDLIPFVTDKDIMVHFDVGLKDGFTGIIYHDNKPCTWYNRFGFKLNKWQKAYKPFKRKYYKITLEDLIE